MAAVAHICTTCGSTCLGTGSAVDNLLHLSSPQFSTAVVASCRTVDEYLKVLHRLIMVQERFASLKEYVSELISQWQCHGSEVKTPEGAGDTATNTSSASRQAFPDSASSTQALRDKVDSCANSSGGPAADFEFRVKEEAIDEKCEGFSNNSDDQSATRSSTLALASVLPIFSVLGAGCRAEDQRGTVTGASHFLGASSFPGAVAPPLGPLMASASPLGPLLAFTDFASERAKSVKSFSDTTNPATGASGLKQVVVLLGAGGKPSTGNTKYRPIAKAEERKYACEKCGARYTNEHMLSKHNILCHSESPKFESPQILSEHEQKAHRSTKDFLPETPSPKAHGATKNTLLQTSSLEQTGLSCVQCDLVFKTKSEGKSHRNAAHKKFCCPECGRKFRAPKMFQEHMAYHRGEEYRHVCETCGKKFPHSGDLTHHRKSHAKAILCPTCGKNFPTNYVLKSHIRRHHAEGGPVMNSPCAVCGKLFLDRNVAKSHERAVHGTEKGYTCSECGDHFRGQSQYATHVKREHKMKAHKCDQCDKAYKDPCRLRIHMRVHTNERPYKCTQCSAAFMTQNTLKSHVLGVHSGLKPYKCEECGDSFGWSVSLLNHRKMHERKRDSTVQPMLTE